ncbi:MAG: FtsX-like permease family protein [Bacteroidota bacterium]|nr:FtsX-like permease family protein [Bacteroidota bacterium]
MGLLVKLAWRNLWRNRRRTMITISAVVFATFLSLIMRGIQLGTYDQNISWALNLFSGYIQLQHPEFKANPSLHRSFHFTPGMREALRNDDRIRGFAPRVYGDGLISFGQNSLGTALFGIDPDEERSVTRMHEKVNAGRMIVSSKASEIVVGRTLLKNLKAQIGDTAVVLSQGYDGALGNMKYRIVGSVRTGMQDFDRAAVFMGFEDLQELVSMQGRVSVVAIALHDLHDIEDVTENLNAGMDTSEVRALSWEEIMPDMKQGIELDNYSGMLMLAILIVIVAFGILNTVLMSVTERFREFGILLSIGMPQRQLVMLVFVETLYMLLIGILVGNVLALGVNLYLEANPITLTGEIAAMTEEYGWLPVMPSVVLPSSMLNTSFAILSISLIAALYPLYRVLTLEPLKGIRYT